MTNEEIWNLGLEERSKELIKLQGEFEQVDIEYRKAEFEKDMYARLKEINSSPLYREKFIEKYEKSVRIAEKLEKHKKGLQDEIAILEKEIYYINSLL